MKIIYAFFSIVFICFLTILIFEVIFQIIPKVYKNIPESSKYSYVYILGESSSAGYPYLKLSYSKILKHILNNKIDNKEIVLIDLSYPGCQLYHQYISYFIYKYFHPFKKGIVLMYMGTNNWAIKKEYSDFSRNILLKFNLVSLFDKYFNLIISKLTCLNISAGDFEYEYEKIVKLANKFGDDIYISTIIGNYGGFPPEEESYRNEFDLIDEEFFNFRFDNAYRLCQKYLQNDNYPRKAQFFYRLGKIYEHDNLISKANETYLKAVESVYDDRPTKFQNDAIRKIAKKYNIDYIDFFNELFNSGNIIGFNYFIDTIHPLLETHMLLAYDFAEKISKKHIVKISDKATIDLNEIKREYNYNNTDELKVYMSRIVELETRGSYSYKYNKKIVSDWIEKVKLLEVDENAKPNSFHRDNFFRLEKEFIDYFKSSGKRSSELEKELRKIYVGWNYS